MMTMRQFAELKGVSAPTVMRACRSGELCRGSDGIDETIPQNAGWAGVKQVARSRKPSPPKMRPVVFHTGPLPKSRKGKSLISKDFRITPSGLITQEMGDRIEEIARTGESFQAAVVSVCPQDVDKAFADYYARKRFTDGHIALHGRIMSRIDDASAVVYARMCGEDRVTLSDGKEIPVEDVTVALASELSKQRIGILTLLRKGLSTPAIDSSVNTLQGPNGGPVEIKPVATDAELDALLVAMAPPLEAVPSDA